MNVPFDVELFKNKLRTTWVGSEFIYIRKVHSTNSWLKQVPPQKLVHGCVTLSDHQVSGRGQYERGWESASCQNLTFTIALRPPKGDRLTLLTLGVARAITQTLERYSGVEMYVKWPNDILAGGLKIGGILTECVFNGPRPERVLIGIGLNIHQKTFGENLTGKATSLISVTNRPFTREDVLSDLLLQIETMYQRWHKMDSELNKEINRSLIGYGEWVQISIYDELQSGIYKFIGVSDKGELLMLNEQLDVNKFSYEQIRIITGNEGIPKEKTGTSI